MTNESFKMALEISTDNVVSASDDEGVEESVSNFFNTKLFPVIDELGIDLGLDHQDRPASPWSISKIGTLQAKIEEYLGSRRNKNNFSFRDPNEIPFNRLINIANETFGHDGWSTEIKNTMVNELAADGEIYSLSAESTVKLLLKDGTYHEAVGYGRAENLPHKGMAYLKCKKESITDATKNAIKDLQFMLLDHHLKVKDGYYTERGLFEF